MLTTITFITIVILIFLNGFTDAPNAITTVVSTNVLPFKKAARRSAFFNLMGIIAMCFINFKIANGISSLVILKNGKEGLIALLSGMLACGIFSGIASVFGIPTSETHGLVAGLTGSAIAIGNCHQVNFVEWVYVIFGLIWSVFGVFVIVKMTRFLFKNKLYKIEKRKIENCQKWTSYGLSFMHGAQDGQKFIGLVILYLSMLKGSCGIHNDAKSNIWIIIFVAMILYMGVSFGGKRIVEKIGNHTVELDYVKGIISDIGTIVNLLLASLWGIPVSTTHVKTMSIIALAEKNCNRKNIFQIVLAWITTFPICFLLSYWTAKLFLSYG